MLSEEDEPMYETGRINNIIYVYICILYLYIYTHVYLQKI